MALIRFGTIDDFTLKANKKFKNPIFKSIRTFSELHEVSKYVPKDYFDFITSKDKRGVSLKSIKLKKGFEGFLQKFLNKENEIYFFAWAWDLSGNSVNFYPGKHTDSSQNIIQIKTGELREFIGEGIDIFPKRKVKGGISIRIHLWESDNNQRSLGKAISNTTDAIQKSKLNNLLSTLSLATGVTGTTVNLIKDASIELANIIGIILKSNGDDHVDFFEGNYSSDEKWIKGTDKQIHTSSELVLTKH